MQAVVTSQSEMRAAVKEAAQKGLRWTQISTQGLPSGTMRLTFYPEAQSING